MAKSVLENSERFIKQLKKIVIFLIQNHEKFENNLIYKKIRFDQIFHLKKFEKVTFIENFELKNYFCIIFFSHFSTLEQNNN